MGIEMRGRERGGGGGLTSVCTAEKERLLPATTEVVMGLVHVP
jgi:hypothetical protein